MKSSHVLQIYIKYLGVYLISKKLKITLLYKNNYMCDQTFLNIISKGISLEWDVPFSKLMSFLNL